MANSSVTLKIGITLSLSSTTFMLAGCNRDVPRTGDAVAAPPALRSAARALIVGRAYDRAVKAAQNEDIPALEAASNELRQAGANNKTISALTQGIVEKIVIQASQLYMTAENLKGAAREQQLARAGTLYRQALQLAPRFDSKNPILLNTLGYFLAERGTTTADFQEAERLTRRAIKLWDEQIVQIEKTGGGQPLTNLIGGLPEIKLQRANTRDSVAWALYRQGRYEEARREQEAALKEAKESSSDSTGESLAELHFHLGEIYRALRRPREARLQYEEALQLKPDHEGTQRGLAALPSDTALKPSATPTPIPSRFSPFENIRET